MYPELTPYNTGFLETSDGHHKLYFEESGSATAGAVIFLHGGPGGGTSPLDRQYFDPSAYRIILLDQRGAGKSLPAASLEHNSTDKLVQDIEQLREHLKIDRWVVFGGSWGSTLSLVYAQTFPQRVKALILRGIFLLRKSELDWLYQAGGAEHLYSDEFEKYAEPIPLAERGHMIAAYHKRLTGDDQQEQLHCARRWSRWEMVTSRLSIDPQAVSKVDQDIWALQFARIECHYFMNEGFIKNAQILDNVQKIRHIPCTIIQGRYDIVCPMKSSWDLHKVWPEAEYKIVQLAGHSARDLQAPLVEAAEKYKTVA